LFHSHTVRYVKARELPYLRYLLGRVQYLKVGSSLIGMWNRLKIAELQSIMSVLPCLWTVRCVPSDVSRTLLLELYEVPYNITCHYY